MLSRIAMATGAVMLSQLAGSLLAADYNDGQGRIWRQPAATTGYTWNQLASQLPTDGMTPGSGPFAGWVWATQQQTIDLFNDFLPPTHQLSVANPGLEAYLAMPFGYTTVFAMNGAPYSFFSAIRGWTSTLDAQGLGIRGSYSEGGNSVSFYAGVSVADAMSTSQFPGYLNETGVWLWRPANDMPGDYNADGHVDAADYTVWNDMRGHAAMLPNDASPGSVGMDDLDAWRANFGGTAGAELTTGQVPEPSSLWIVASGVWCLWRVRRLM